MLVFLRRMKQKTLIIFDLRDKSNAQRSRILQKLYGYRDKSNYDYSYQRESIFKDVSFEKSRKTVLYIQNYNDVAKVTEALNHLKVRFEIARM